MHEMSVGTHVVAVTLVVEGGHVVRARRHVCALRTERQGLRRDRVSRAGNKREVWPSTTLWTDRKSVV